MKPKTLQLKSWEAELTKVMPLLLPLILLVTLSAHAVPKVGVILPLSGDFAYFGEEFRSGLELGMEDASKGRAGWVELIFEDDRCSGKEGVTAFKKLTEQNKVALVIEPACSASIRSVAHLAERRKEPTVFLLDSGPEVKALKDPVYTLGFDPVKMAFAIGDDLAKEGIQSVGMITEEEEYAVWLSKSFKERVTQLGITISSESNQLTSERDFRPQILKVIQSKPGAIFFSAAYETGTFLKQLRTLSPTVPIYGTDTMCVPASIESAGAAAEGVRCGNVLLDESSSGIASLRSRLEARNGKAPTTLFYTVLGYEAARLIFELLNLPVPIPRILTEPLLRNEAGAYEFVPEVLTVESGKMRALRGR